MRLSILSPCAVFCLLASTQAFALDYIYSPIAEPGELAVEYSGSRTFDGSSAKNGAQEHELKMEYGFDRLTLEGSAGFSKEPQGNLHFSDYELESRLQLFQQGRYWLDAGLLAAFQKSVHSTDPNSLEIKLLLQKDVGRFTNIANIGFTQDVGHNAAGGPDYVFLWNTRYRYNEEFQPGIEIQSALGQDAALRRFNAQQHYIGPAVYGRLFGHVQYQAAWLAGVSDSASTSAARLLLEYEMHI
ncbi:MAG: hypothetical protein KGL10_07200 [Alphaproteobacteria bacterium]|nr:hypothetical protein [Alphaproteobacteria bacterium]MDE2337080.1 hypothetical protein [Alphaproteobacteria bacterium]